MAKLIMTVAEMADEKKWLEARREGIGGSDASVIVGLNRWKSPFQLWLEKTGKAEPEDLSDNEYVYWGKVLEEAVANRFCELTGKKVQRRGLLQMDGCPYIIASVDRMVVGENAGLECKTCNGFAAKEWEDDEVPAAYYVQCQHYMMVTGCERWYIAVLIGGNRFVWKEIPRNDKEIDLLFQAETEFWHKVQEGIMPEVDGSESCKDALVAEFQGGIAEPLTLPGMAVWIIEQIRKIEDAKNDLEIKCGDEPPWVRIPPSLPLKNKASWRFPRSLFCAHFSVKNRNLGTFWAHEILKVDFMVLEMRGADIENEDAVQHPRIHLSITFEVLVGDV